jgi:aryl sulfotransferase
MTGHLRVSPQPSGARWSQRTWGSWGGTLAFDTGASTIRFGAALEEAEAAAIARRLVERHPGLAAAAPSQRSQRGPAVVPFRVSRDRGSPASLVGRVGGKTMTDALGAERIAWPEKRRELHSHHFDSTIWNDLHFRGDDIVIATYGKAGTTWTQQIVGQLVFGGDPDVQVAEISPWLDLRVPPKVEKLPLVEAQTHRRFLKTHLPVDALRFSPRAKYLYVARDGRDVVWSLYNHHANANQTWYEALNDTPGRVGPPIGPPPADIRQYWREWLDRDGHPFWPFWENVRSWWQIRHLPNVKLVHFANLKRDLPGQIRGIAAFLEIPIDTSCWADILEHCSFEWMKRNGAKTVPAGGAFWDAGADVFIHKGVNGRWAETLTAEESAEYEARALAELGPDGARWLATGEGGD